MTLRPPLSLSLKVSAWNLDSPAQCAAVLFDRAGIAPPPGEQRGRNEHYSTSEEVRRSRARARPNDDGA